MPATTSSPSTAVIDPTAIPTAAVTEPVVSEAMAEPTAPGTSAAVAGVGALSPETLAAINSFLNSAYDGRLFPSSVLVARNGKVLSRKGVGLADQSAGILTRPDTKFVLVR